jgi:hypothetical protein
MGREATVDKQPTFHQGPNAEQWTNRFRAAVAQKNMLNNPDFHAADDAIRFRLPARETVPVFLRMLQEENHSAQLAALYGITRAVTLERNRVSLFVALPSIARALRPRNNTDARCFAAEAIGRKRFTCLSAFSA